MPTPPAFRRGAGAGSAIVLAAMVLPLVLGPSAGLAQSGAASGGADPCSEGLRLFRARDHAAAEPALRRCAETNSSPEALVALAAIASLSKRSAEASDFAARAVELDSTSVEARYWLGRALLQRGDRAQAGREWEKALRLSTDHPGVLEGLARLAIDAGETAKAYGLLTQLVRTGQAEGWTHRLLADLARRKRMWGDALRHWRDAMGAEGEDAASLLTAGELAILAGDTTVAVESTRKAVALEATATTLAGLGEALFAARRYEEAATRLQRAVDLAPDDARSLFNLANVLELLDRSDEAEPHFHRFVELAPDDAIGRFNYGIHLDKRGRLVEALAQVEAAVRLAPDMMTAQVVRARLLESLERWDEAAAAIDALLRHAPEDSVQLGQWRASVVDRRDEEARAHRLGLLHLLHIVTADTASVRQIGAELRAGADFTVLATRFSFGPTAAQGGDIGRVSPADLVEPLRTAVQNLQVEETTPPLEARGLWHFFKRVR